MGRPLEPIPVGLLLHLPLFPTLFPRLLGGHRQELLGLDGPWEKQFNPPWRTKVTTSESFTVSPLTPLPTPIQTRIS